MRLPLLLLLTLTTTLLTAQPRQLQTLTLSGSGYELGLQHGEALSADIAEIVTKWKENTTNTFGRDADEVLAEFFDYADFDGAIRKWTPDLYDEVRGIADGSGQEFEDIMVLNLLDEFWVWIDQLSNHHCSDVGVPSVNGSTSYVAQNMDIENYTDGYQTLIRLEATDDRPEQFIFTHPGLIVLNGMNESGVGVVVNTIMQLKASNDGVPVAFVVRRIVNSTDKDDLLEFLTSVPHASGQSYILGIRGEVFNFEASAGKVVRVDPGNPNGTVYHTNHPVVNTNVKEWYDEFDPEKITDDLAGSSNTHIRYEALRSRMTGYELINDDIIKETLRSKDDPANPVCRMNTGSRGFTFGSTIMTLTGTPHLLITAGPPDESEYVRYDFN